MTQPIIYHGTPMTPRAALHQMAGRAFCVSFYRPDDVEVVEAISPAVMFRQWRVFILASRIKSWSGLGRGSGLATILQMAGASIANRALGSNTRQPWRTFTDQRWIAERLAFWSMGRTALAHGQSDRSLATALRQIRAGLFGMDGAGQRFHSWLRGMVSTHGRSCKHVGQSMAQHSYDAWRNGCARVSLSQCRQHQPSAEWTSI
jgi:hypothetical protein